MTTVRPSAAWLRAGAYFAICLALSFYTGVLASVLSWPPVSDSDLADPRWWGMTAVVTAYTLFAYAFFWPRGTVTHGRPRRVAAGLVFGSLWGFCQGQLMLVVVWLAEQLALPTVFTIAMAFAVWSVFAALWQSLYWDVRVAPPHNIEAWNLRKVLISHMPFLLLCLVHYAMYGNAALFVAWQVIALVASSLAMRFPSPFDRT